MLADRAPKGMKVAVAGASDEVVLKAVRKAFDRGIVDGACSLTKD